MSTKPSIFRNLNLRFSIPVALGIVVMFSFACDQTETETISLDLGYDYFPLHLGERKVYQLDSIIFDPQSGGIRIDTISSLIRETVTDTFRDASGLLTYRIERERRLSSNAPWQPSGTFAEARDDRRAYRQEGNFRYWKMTFPLSISNRWNPTAFFDPTQTVAITEESLEFFEGWEARVISLGEPFQTDKITFDNTAVIQLSDFENLIEVRRAREVYAAGVGLVFQEWQIIDTQCRFCCAQDFAQCENLPWEEKGEKGVIIRMTLVE